MDNRKFQAAASATPPSAPGSPSSGYPTNGNPGTGTPATLPGEFWFHSIGEEIRAAIVGSGQTPSAANLAQLWQAIMPGKSLSSGGGYIGLPSGLILQMGSASFNTTGVTNTFPIVFPNALIGGGVFYGNTGAAGTGVILTTLSFTLTNFITKSSASSGGYPYLAIGY